MRRSRLQWIMVVGMLLIAVQLTGCSSEQQPGSDAIRPVVDPVEPPSPPTPAPQSAAELPETAELDEPSAAAPADAADNAVQDEAVASDAKPSPSLQESLDNEPPPVDGDTVLSEFGYVSPSDKVRDLLADPPGATRISQQSSLWVDVKAKRVFADGYVAQREAYLEMFACPAETKEHESIVGVVAQSSEVHAALLAVGATQGTPVRWDTDYVPATGQRIRIWVMWYDENGEFQYSDARRWVRHIGTEDSLKLDWVFAGSSLWKDPSDGKEYYQADGGEMICVSNFSTALMDLPVESSDANNELQFDAFTQRIPPPGTPLRLMLVPIPPTGDDATEPPTEELMPRNQSAED